MKLYKNVLIVLLLTLLMQPSILLAKTTRTTNVYVQNLTGLEIESVSVVHKYSNVFKERNTWGKLHNGQRTREPMKIRYNTGIGTTGQDWWYVAWKFKGDKRVQYTSPNNFRNIIDAVERGVGKAMLGFSKMTGDPVILDKMAKASTSAATNALFNNESTNGFKKHFLKKKDQERGLMITITLNSVKFDSASGHSSTEGIKTAILNIQDAQPPGSRDSKPSVQRVAIRQSCTSTLQDKIAWDYNGNKHWALGNLKSLCGNTNSIQPAVCFNKVMHGGVNWGNGTQWQYQNAMNLCRNSTDATKTVNCFIAVNKKQKGQWNNAINACKAG